MTAPADPPVVPISNNGMVFTPVNDLEIGAFLRAWEHLQEWRLFVDFAIDWFGPAQVARVHVTVEQEYDDNSYNDEITNVSVYNRANVRLGLHQADLTTSWWVQRLRENDTTWVETVQENIRTRTENANDPEHDDDDNDAWDLLNDLWSEEYRSLDLPVHGSRFTVAEPPALPFVALFKCEGLS
jgi:hypothetical protein